MTRTTGPHTATGPVPATVPSGDATAQDASFIDVTVTTGMLTALLYLSPLAVLDWHVKGPTVMAGYLLGVIELGVNDPTTRLRELGDLFASLRFPVDYPLDHERLTGAQNFANRVMDTLLTTTT